MARIAGSRGLDRRAVRALTPPSHPHLAMSDVRLDTTLGRDGPPVARRDVPFRLLLVGDFAGRGASGASDPSTVAARRPRRVDLDRLDAEVRASGARVTLPSVGGRPAETLVVDAVEALTPDGLYARLATIAAVRAAVSAPPPVAPPRGAVRGGAVLDAILDEATPDDPMARMAEAGGDLSAFIAAALKGHTVSAAEQESAARAHAVEVATDAVVRGVLRWPAFRALESLWLSVALMSKQLDAARNVELWWLDISPDELSSVLPTGGDPLASPLASALRTAPDPDGWALLVGAFDVTGSPDDIERLGQLAALGAALDTPWLLGAAPALTGFDALDEAADATTWPEAPPMWEAFRRTGLAPWVACVPNGLLLRAPYGTDGEQVERPFEEVARAGEPIPFAWSPPAFAAALAVGLAYGATEGDLRRAGAYPVDGLPFVMVAGRAVPAGQVLLSERAMAACAARGLLALETNKSAGVVRLRGLTSCAVPAAPLAGAWRGGT